MYNYTAWVSEGDLYPGLSLHVEPHEMSTVHTKTCLHPCKDHKILEADTDLQKKN